MDGGDRHHLLACMFFSEMSCYRVFIHHSLDFGNGFIPTSSIHFDLVTAGTGKLKISHWIVLLRSA